jgi:hypothetical protein
MLGNVGQGKNVTLLNTIMMISVSFLMFTVNISANLYAQLKIIRFTEPLASTLLEIEFETGRVSVMFLYWLKCLYRQSERLTKREVVGSESYENIWERTDFFLKTCA